MTKTYTLKGLDCANCAAKIEAEVGALRGVTQASLNFAACALRVEAADADARRLTALIEAVVHSHEPGVRVSDNDARGARGHHGDAASEHDAHSAHGHGDAASGCDGHGAHGQGIMAEHDALGAHGRGAAVSDEGARDEHEHEHAGNGAHIARIAAGAAVYAAALLMEHAFHVSGWAPLAVYIAAYIVLGGDVLLKAARNITRGRLFDENFLMSVATLGALAIGEYPEAVAVMLFYQAGEFFQGMAVRRSRASIAGLMDIRPDFANVMRDGQLVKVMPDSVNVGDTIIVKPGERIPLDGVVRAGEAQLDARALTGESTPRTAAAGDSVLSGCVSMDGALTIEVTHTYGQSTVSKILALVEEAGSRKARTERFITTFSRYYTPAVVALAALVALVPPLVLGGGWADWMGRGLILLVISCPCALVISIPLGFFGGIGAASRSGVLVKGGNYLEALGRLEIAVFDKTGTLTKGVFAVTAVLPAPGYDDGRLLRLAAHAEALSNHPVAQSIVRAFDGDIERAVLSDYRETPGRGVRVTIDGTNVLAGSAAFMEASGVPYDVVDSPGVKVYVAEDGVCAGCVVIADEVKPDSAAAITALKARGVRKTVMLTGDEPAIAARVAHELGLDEAVGGLLPAQKVEAVEALNAQKRDRSTLAFIGDGVNDAPVLARADIGVAMGALGSDAAIEAADVIIMTDEPSKLAVAVDIARATKRVVWQNIFFALGVKGTVLLLGALGMATMWEAVFADVGVALVAVLNATRVARVRPRLHGKRR